MANESTIGPRVAITGEVEFKQAIENINNEFKLLTSEMKLAVSQFDKNDKSTVSLTAQNKVLGKEIDSQKGRISTLTTQYDKQNSALVTLKDKLDATKAAFGADSAEVAKAQKEYDDQTQIVRSLQVELNKAATGLNKMDSEMAKNSKSIDLQNSNWTKMGKSLNDAGDSLKTTGEGFTSAGKKLSLGLTAPIIAAGTGIAAMVISSTSAADALRKMSDTTGLSIVRLQELQYIGVKLDVELDTMTNAQKFLTKAMSAAQGGTKAQSDIFKTLGVSVVDSTGHLRDSNVVFNEVIAALGKMTNPTERNAMALKLFGKSALELNPLITAGAGEIAKLTAEAHKNGAVMSEESVTAMHKFSDSMAALKLSVSNAVGKIVAELIPTFNKLIPVVQDQIIPAIGAFAQKIADLVLKFANLDPFAQKVILGFVGFALAIGPALVFGGSLLTVLGGIALAFGTVSGAIAILTTEAVVATPAIAGVSVAIEGVSAASGTLAGVITALMGPVGWVIAAVVALIAIGVLLYKNWDWLKAQAVNLGVVIATAWDGIKLAIATKISDIIAGITTWLDNMPGTITTKLAVWKAAIATWFTNTKTDIITQLGEWWVAMELWFGSIPAKIVTKLLEWKAAIVQWTKEQNAENIRQFSEWGLAIENWFMSIPAKITQQLTDWGKAISKWYDDTKIAVGQQLTAWWVAIGQWYDNTKVSIITKLGEWWIAIGKWYDDTKANISNSLTGWWVAIGQWYTDTKNNIPIKLAEWWVAMGKWYDDTKANIMEKLAGWWVSIKDWFTNMGSDSIKALTAGTNTQKQSFMDNLGKIVVDALEFLLVVTAVVIVAVAREIIKRLISGITNGAGEIKNAFVTAMDNGINYLKSLPGQAIQWGRDMISRFVDGFKSIHIPMPHFNISGSFSLNPPSIPSIGVSWYDKGGVFNSPSIIGVGEKRPEFVGALDDLKYIVRSEIERASDSGSGKTLPGNNYTFAPGSIIIPAKDLAEMRTVQDFFNRLPQVARAMG